MGPWSASASRVWLALPLLALLLVAAVPPGRAAAPPAGRPPAAAGDSSAIAFAVVRSDAILIPIAFYDGSWSNKWPAPDKQLALPASIEAIPKKWWSKSDKPILDWWFWPEQGDAQEVHAVVPIGFPAECQIGVGMRLNTLPMTPPPPPTVQPYPKDGLAVAPKVDVERIPVVAEQSTEWVTLSRRIADEVNAREAGAVIDAKRSQRRLPKSYLDYDGTRVPVKVERLYTVPGPRKGTWVSYFEATKYYGKLPADPNICADVTSAFGWVVRGDNGWTTRANVVLTDCGMAGAYFMHPLGVVTLGLKAKRYWIGQWSTWGQESYAVMELQADALPKTVFEVSGGGFGECAAPIKR